MRKRLTGYLAVFVAALAVQTYNLTTPSLWWDEAATKASFINGWAGIDAITLHLDVVHKLYYQIAFLVTQVFGVSTLSLRLPSAIASALASVLMVALAKRLGLSAPAAYFAGLLLAILPRVTWASLEARSYSMDVLTGVLTALLLVAAVQRSIAPKHSGPENTKARVITWLWWLAYAASMIFATYLYMYQVLLLLAHPAYLLARRVSKAAWMRWLAAAAVVAASAIPLVLTAKAQQQQVAWIHFYPAQALGLFASQMYPHDWASPWVVLALLVGFAVFNWRKAKRHQKSPFATTSTVTNPAVTTGAKLLGAAWLVLPSLALMVVSVIATPIYNSRYLSFTMGGFALLVSAVIFRRQNRWLVGVLVLLLCASISASEYLNQRTPYAFNSDWLQASQALAPQTHPGDAVIFTDSRRYPVQRVSVMAAAYPEAFKNLTDVTLHPNPNHLLGDRTPWKNLGGQLSRFKAVWVIEDRRSDAGELARADKLLRRLGFVQNRVQNLHFTSLYRYSK